MIKRDSNREYESIEIQSNACCPLFINHFEESKAVNTYKISKASSSVSSDKRRTSVGLRRIKSSLSQCRLNFKQISISRQVDGEVTKRHHLRQQNQNNQIKTNINIIKANEETNHVKERINENKFRTFKNKIIQQHHQNLNLKIVRAESILLSSKNISTRKNTPRDSSDVNESLQLPQPLYNIHLSQIKVGNKNMSLMRLVQLDSIGPTSFCQYKRIENRKTLEQICSQMHKKKILTIQSQGNQSEFCSELDNSFVYNFDKLS